MQILEATGSWQEMGEQYGRSLTEQIVEMFERMIPEYADRPDAVIAAARQMEASLPPEAKVAIEHARGIADGAALQYEQVVALQFAQSVRRRIQPSCSVIYLADSDVGPIMARNNDGGLKEESTGQYACAYRPTDHGNAVIHTGYIGTVGAIGINEHGLCIGSSSAHTNESHGNEGMPAGLLMNMILHNCQTTQQAADFLAKHKFFGKPCNVLIGDQQGDSILFEFVSGKTPIANPRDPSRSYQYCTNFFTSGKVQIKDEPGYLYNAYARYGRIAHRLVDQQMPATLENLIQLIIDIAQPGLVMAEHRINMHTMYTQVMEARQRKMHVFPGHPKQVQMQTLAI